VKVVEKVAIACLLIIVASITKGENVDSSLQTFEVYGKLYLNTSMSGDRFR